MAQFLSNQSVCCLPQAARAALSRLAREGTVILWDGRLNLVVDHHEDRPHNVLRLVQMLHAAALALDSQGLSVPSMLAPNAQQDTVVEVRLASLRSLLEEFPEAPETFATLKTLMSEGDEVMKQVAAALALTSTHAQLRAEGSSEAALLAALSSSVTVLREAATVALGTLSSPAVLRRLREQCANEKDPALRALAKRSLAQILLRDGDSSVGSVSEIPADASIGSVSVAPEDGAVSLQTTEPRTKV